MAQVLTLPQYLARLAAKRWRWGETDCLMVLADWVLAHRGVDPAAAWRGTYATERGARRIVDAAGGMVPLVDLAMRAIGRGRAETSTSGAIAVAHVRGADIAAGAICVDARRFAFLTPDRGVIVAGGGILEPLAIWAV